MNPADLAQLKNAWEFAFDKFKTVLSAAFPGATEYHWYRALSAVKGENCQRNDNTSQDAAMAADANIRAAYDEYIRLLHVFYRARDGVGGVLGGRGL